MRIGELARRAGTTTRALRYYESLGLLRAHRTANGYRDYGEEDLRLLRQIRTLQDFGFELEETRPFVECLRAGHPAGDACPASLEVYRRKLAELDDCIDRLRTVRREIAAQLSRAETVAGRADGPVDGPVGGASAPEPRCLLSPCEPPGPHGPATDGPPDAARERRTGTWR
ncbi:MerR family transcriptional regulator [Streptomyces carminius]|uniref:MerR family transcriptional regulator n=1 Tax=Streptomyces carminius TaxID=2665496 RepID=A0A2M8M0M5_9ACTN|nr:MerR family transcriptional regulator [Streptomyces carminius]PJE97054.1 MerR family transcriptional regulator [Streptomyces carminius]PJE97763.1 MerR family transcriptional regulator [Streptomyces carminius]